MCDTETRKKLNDIQTGLVDIKVWCAKRDETIMQHQRAIELLMTKAEKEIALSSENYKHCRETLQTLSQKFDNFQINDYVPFKTKVIVISGIIGLVIGIGASYVFGL